jgi:hypothetical protein
MTIESLNKRLTRLSDAASPMACPGAGRRVIQLTREEDEPVATAIVRWCEAHPDEPPPSEDDNTNIIVRTMVDPTPMLTAMEHAT